MKAGRGQVGSFCFGRSFSCSEPLFRALVPSRAATVVNLAVADRLAPAGPGSRHSPAVVLSALSDQPRAARMLHGLLRVPILPTAAHHGECIPVSGAIRLRGMPPILPSWVRKFCPDSVPAALLASRDPQTLERSASRPSTDVRDNDQFKNGDI
jgi:hypothetical protein